MFDAYCPTHGGRILLPTSHVLRITTGDGRIAALLRCWCGDVAVWRASDTVPA
jgi:hypothetical protein